jgi:maltoporin
MFHWNESVSRMDNLEKMASLETKEKDKQNKKHNTICLGHHHTQTNTNNVNKT